MPSLKIKTSMSTTQGCYKLCSEVSVLTAALAVVVGGIDGSKCALCLSFNSAVRSLEPRFCGTSPCVPHLAQHTLLLKND